jgi:uncharacterized membrane protein
MHIPLTPLAFLFTTWWSALAVAGAAASIPIIIHLLNRRRFRVVVWAAMRFLLMAQKQNTRRMRLEQLILLAVRTLLVLLVVLAMASVMPWAEAVWAYFWPEGGGRIAVRGGRTHKVLVLDGSLSMALRQKGDTQTAFDRARDRAVEIVKSSPAGDSFSVLLMTGNAPRRLAAKPSPKKDAVVRQLEQLNRHPHGNADVGTTLLTVEKILGESAGRFQRTEVYFLSDMQRTTWLPGLARDLTADGSSARPGNRGRGDTAAETNPLSRLQDRALKVFVDVGRDGVDNLAVTDLHIDAPFITTGATVHVTAAVKNYGTRDRRNVRIELIVAKAGATPRGQPFSRRRAHPAKVQLFDLERGLEGHLVFGYRFKEPGEYAVQVRLGPDDLTVDNTRTVVVTVKKFVRVLLVNGKTARDPFEGGAEYLRKALNPVFDGPVTGEMRLLSRVQPRVVKEADFADLNETDLDPYDCIFLCDVDRPDPTGVRRLKYHLRRGGGVVFCAGPQMAAHLDRYNRLLYEGGKGILPARLVAVQASPADHYFGFDLSKASFQQPPLKEFDSEDGRLLLRTVRFRQYVRASIPPRLTASPVLTFQPKVGTADKRLDRRLPIGDPAILLWQPLLPTAKKDAATPGHYRGWVGFIATSVNMDWTTWPASPSYLPMMHELLRLSVAGRLREQSALVGDVLEEFLQAVGQKEARVHTPDGRTLEHRTELTDDASVFHWGDTDQSGIYRVTIGPEAREHLFAVNVPTATAGQKASESDFSKPRCDAEALKAAYPGWRFQIVTDPARVDRAAGPEKAAAGAQDGETQKGKIGPSIAWGLLLAVFALLLTEVVLAWRFGHYSAVSGTAGSPPASGRLLPGVLGAVAGIIFLGMAWVLVDAAVTGDFLGFLPEGIHGFLEEQLDIPKAQEGESNAWKLESVSFLTEDDDPWLVGGLAVAALALVVFIYVREGRTARAGYRLLLAGLRIFLVLLTITVLLPQLQIHFERRDWPDLVIIIDDSGSMGEADDYQDEGARDAARKLTRKLQKDLKARLPAKLRRLREDLAAARARLDEQERGVAPGDAAAAKRVQDARAHVEELAEKRKHFEALQANLVRGTWRPSRLQLVTALLTMEKPDWLTTLLTRRKMKLYVYHLDRAGQAVALGDVNGTQGPERHKELLEKIRDLRAHAQASPLDRAIHKVLGDFGTSSLGAVVMFTDGVTVPGIDGDVTPERKDGGRNQDPLVAAAEAAGTRGVPLFFVGLGDARGLRDIRLLSLDAPDVVHVRDHIEFKTTLRGYQAMKVPLVLYEKSKDGSLVERQRKPVNVEPGGREVAVTIRHQPQEAGEKTFVVRLEVPRPRGQKDVPRADRLELQRKVLVEDVKLVHVLYIEGAPRYEYRYIKTLLERESAEDKTNKTVDLKVVLLDADDDYAREDKSALAYLPPNKAELNQYDLIILGDVDPQSPKIKDRLQDIADFVRERGGGFLMIAGENYSPHAYKDTPLEAILPIELDKEPPAEERDIERGYRPVLTLEGQGHPIFRFSQDSAEDLVIWGQLAELFWYSKGYRTKPAAHVLAVHPEEPGLGRPRANDPAGGKHPLVVYELVGGGRSMFFGFDETWRWRFRQYEARFNQFWKNTVDFLARRRRDRIELRLNKQTPYVRGEVIRVTVRFPESAQAQQDVKVTWRRYPQTAAGPLPRPERTETLKLAKTEAWATDFEGRVGRTREGRYVFELTTPENKSGPVPSAECVVLPPEQELERLSMNEQGMTAAARKSRGKFFTLADADQLLDSLPEGERVQMNSSRPPSLLWNQPAVFFLVLFLLGSEWILRKRKHLL